MGRISRSFYKPSEREPGIYLHVYNHCVENSKNEFPLSDTDKEMFIQQLRKLLKFYTIECLSVVCLSNHYHMILYIPLRKYTPVEMAKILNWHKRGKLIVEAGDDYCLRRATASNDISHFMKELQRCYTMWYNKSRKFTRRGTLWEQRFKSQKLVGDEAVATCLQYVELNPVRAGICDDPADYRFSSYGIWQQSGTHPFSQDFCKRMTGILAVYLESKDMQGLSRYFRGRYTGIIAGDQGKTMEETDALVLATKVDPSVAKQLMRKSRYYINSVVIGSKLALRQQARLLWGEKRALKKRFGRLFEPGTASELLGIRQLRY